MTGTCPGCGAEACELSALYKDRVFSQPVCWCCRMRGWNELYEGFDPFECAPDDVTREIISAFSRTAERQIAIEERRDLRRRVPKSEPIPEPE